MEREIPFTAISAVTGDGIDPLIRMSSEALDRIGGSTEIVR
jgi:hypothetical protein